MLKILFVKLGALGDLTFALPAPTAFKNIYRTQVSPKEVEFTWVVGKSLLPLLEGHPDIDKLISVDEADFFRGGKIGRVKALARLFWDLDVTYDAILIGYRDQRYAQFFRGATFGPIYILSRGGTPEILKHQDIQIKKSETLYITDVKAPPLELHESLVLRRLVFAAAVGLGTNLKSEEEVPWEGTLAYLFDIKNVSAQANKPIVIHMGGGTNVKSEFKFKRWPHWKELIAKLLVGRASETSIILVGAPSESLEAEGVENQTSNIVNLVGKTTLPELVSVIRQARVFFGVDSGPLHLADFLGVPSVGLYGPTSTQSWGMLGAKSVVISTAPPCSPCYRDDGHFPECEFNHKCMVTLDVNKVLNAIQKLGI